MTEEQGFLTPERSVALESLKQYIGSLNNMELPIILATVVRVLLEKKVYPATRISAVVDTLESQLKGQL